jgi:hypothetical protein
VPGSGGTSSTTSDGSTLKVTAPVPQSPINGARPEGGHTLVVAPSSALYVPAIAVKYRFQVFNSANTLVDDSLQDGPSYDVQVELTTNQGYSWQARAESINGDVGPWSPKANFVAGDTAFLRGNQFSDPLKNGRTVGQQHGGIFIPGEGWRAVHTSDGIDYDLTEPCSACVLEFDTTGFNTAEGASVFKDLKWLTMGDASSFGSFGAFRDSPWKMHLEQRSDGDGTGMKIIFRNGAAAHGEDPGDHEIKLGGTSIFWDENTVYHFRLEWDGGGFGLFVDGELWMADGFAQPYAPPNHRVSLGCWPRDETLWGAIFRNVKLRRL